MVIFKAVLITFFCTMQCLFIPTVKSAEDFSNLSLEELTYINVYAASVLSAHIHQKGDWMFGYDYMSMAMDGIRDGNSNISTNELFNPSGYNYMVAPLDMNMSMHMFHLMYAPSNDLTLMLMLLYHNKSMTHRRRDGLKFRTQSKGFGDAQLKANYVLSRNDTQNGESLWFMTLGFSMANGSITKNDKLPVAGQDGLNGMTISSRLPFPMQLGSGTYDLVSGLGYLHLNEKWLGGVHFTGVFRFNHLNAESYHWGETYEGKIWASRAYSDALRFNFRLEGKTIGEIHTENHHASTDHSDAGEITFMVPTADPHNFARDQLTVISGFEYEVKLSNRFSHRFGFELSTPVYQFNAGPNMKTKWGFSISWIMDY